MKKISLIIILLLFACAKKADEAAAITKAPEVIGEEVDYSTKEVTLKGYVAYDKNITGKRPGVLVVHEWWGHNDYTRKRVDMLAELGYIALAVDMYGDGKTADHPKDAMKFMTETMNNIEEAEARFQAALDVLKSNEMTDGTKLAAIGYCFGGGVVLHVARKGFDLKGVASFHGTIATQSPAKEGDIKAALLVANGAADPFVKAEDIEKFKQEMDAAKVDYTFINYEGAQHAFTNPEADSAGIKFKMPLAYNEKADKESWAELQKFFDRVLK